MKTCLQDWFFVELAVENTISAHKRKTDLIMTITSVLAIASRLMVAKIRITFKNPP